MNSSAKPRRAKSCEVSSRYLSPTSNSHAIASPNCSLSPVRCKNITTAATISDTRKHKITHHSSGSSFRGLWPSSGININSSTEKVDSLANHLGNERLKDLLGRKDQKNFVAADCNPFSINRQRSCSEFNRFGNERNDRGDSIRSKENDRLIIGGSMRYSGKMRFNEKSPSTSFRKSSSPNIGSSQILPRRLSVDDGTLTRRKSDSFVDSFESGSESNEMYSNDHFRPAKDKSSISYMSSTLTSTRMLNVNVGLSDSNTMKFDKVSSKMRKFTIKNAIKKANLLTGHGSSASQWALSPGRSCTSIPVSVESNKKSMSFSNLKPPSSPSRTNGVEKLFNIGLDLFKNKKSSHSNNSTLSPVGSGLFENVHQLRLLHNRLIQWRFVNARTVLANDRIANGEEINLINASNSITSLRQSVLQKKVQLQKEKLEANLNFILRSQVKLLEVWGDMERQHSSVLLKIGDSLHSVVCRVPLIEGAKVDTQSASIALKHASDLSASIKSTVTTFSPEAEKIVVLKSELAEVVAQEKCILEECVELLSILPSLEIEELSLKCHIIQRNK